MKNVKNIICVILVSAILMGTDTVFAATEDVLLNENSKLSLSDVLETPENYEIVGASKGYVAGETKVSILGDSISTYVGYTTYGDYYGNNFGNYYNESIMPVEDTWWMGLLIDNQWTLDANESLGGSSVSSLEADNPEALPYMASDERIRRLGDNGEPDKIFVYGGTNDILSQCIPIGKYSPNLTFGKVDTFADAYYTMIKKIETEYPNAEIICMIPYDTIWADTYETVKDAQKQVPRIIKGICNQEGISCIDLRNAGIDEHADMIQGDYIHPNASGMAKIKAYVETYLLMDDRPKRSGKCQVPHYTTDDGVWDCETGILTLNSGEVAKDCFFCDGTYTYYLQHDGTPMKNRLTYHPDGVHVIYFDENGHEVFNNFIQVKQSIAGTPVDDLCFFNTYGYMYVDVITYDQSGTNLYYVNPCGVIERNGWFTFSEIQGGGPGYANWDGTLLTNQFSFDAQGRVVYFQGDGTLARGVISDGTKYYQMDENDGHLIGTF